MIPSSGSPGWGDCPTTVPDGTLCHPTGRIWIRETGTCKRARQARAECRLCWNPCVPETKSGMTRGRERAEVLMQAPPVSTQTGCRDECHGAYVPLKGASDLPAKWAIQSQDG